MGIPWFPTVYWSLSDLAERDDWPCRQQRGAPRGAGRHRRHTAVREDTPRLPYPVQCLHHLRCLGKARSAETNRCALLGIFCLVLLLLRTLMASHKLLCHSTLRLHLRSSCHEQDCSLFAVCVVAGFSSFLPGAITAATTFRRASCTSPAQTRPFSQIPNTPHPQLQTNKNSTRSGRIEPRQTRQSS